MFLQDNPERHRQTGIGNPNSLAPTIPDPCYICFQMTFCIITTHPALIAGAFADRMKFSAMLWFIGLWANLRLGADCAWVWGPDGFLSPQRRRLVKVLDFAGGTVVSHHNPTAGVAGLMCSIILGTHRDRAGAQPGCSLHPRRAAMVGWFGFQRRLRGFRQAGRPACPCW